jgi:hypothetical protein
MKDLSFSMYRVMTFVARVDGSGGGFSRIISGGGVLGGVGRSERWNEIREK